MNEYEERLVYVRSNIGARRDVHYYQLYLPDGRFAGIEERWYKKGTSTLMSTHRDMLPTPVRPRKLEITDYGLAEEKICD